jgi:aminopeptidase YwaD
VRAFDVTRHLVEAIGPRWIGSEGERLAGDWLEGEFRKLGFRVRRLWFDCPAWDYRGTELSVDGAPVTAGAQMFSTGCDVEAELVRIQPDGKGGFSGDVAGRIAVFKESESGGVAERGRLAHALSLAGAKAAVVVSVLPGTWSTKIFRHPHVRFSTAAVSGRDGERLLGQIGRKARLVIDADPREGKTSEVIAQTGPEAAPLFIFGAHYDAAPYSPGALDNAAGVGVLMDLAERLTREERPVRLRFCAFSGHEYGGLDVKAFGSKLYTLTHPQELADARLYFNFDGVGAPGSHPLLAVYGSDELLARVRAFAKSFDDVEVKPASGGGSDHGVFVDAGVEAVWMQSACGTGGGSPPVAPSYYAQAYHSPLDDLRCVDESAQERCAEVAYALVQHILRKTGEENTG